MIEPFIYKPVEGRSRLVLRDTELQLLTDLQETDARTAASRGLQEYLQALEVYWEGGRASRFEAVHQSWAEPEDIAQYPGACVYSQEPGVYDEDAYSSRLIRLPQQDDDDPVHFLRQGSEFTQAFMVEFWCTDRAERVALTAMLEAAFDPVDWMAGFRLDLPHYFNARCTYLKRSMAYLDDSTNAERRRRGGVFTIEASLPQLQAVGTKPRARLIVDTGDGPGRQGEIGEHVVL